MAISIKCPHCGQSGQVPSESVGKTANCSRCKAKFVVSAIDGGPPAPSAVKNNPGSSPAHGMTFVEEPAHCPKCYRDQSVSLDFAGKEVLCERCGHNFSIETTEELLAALGSGNADLVQKGAGRFRYRKCERAIAGLVNALNDTRETTVSFAIQALGFQGKSVAVGPLFSILSHPSNDDYLSLIAVEALEMIGGEATKVAERNAKAFRSTGSRLKAEWATFEKRQEGMTFIRGPVRNMFQQKLLYKRCIRMIEDQMFPRCEKDLRISTYWFAGRLGLISDEDHLHCLALFDQGIKLGPSRGHSILRDRDALVYCLALESGNSHEARKIRESTDDISFKSRVDQIKEVGGFPQSLAEPVH